MMQLSRPYQIALTAMGLLAVVWFVALRGHSSGTEGSGSSPPAASSPAAKPSAPSSVYHGSAPGVEGLTRAIQKARGAVAQSETNAKQLQEKAAQASSSTQAAPAQAATGTSTTGSQAKPSVNSHAPATTKKGPPGSGASGSKAGSSVRMQGTVEGELKAGKLVAILFWNPKGSVDQAVRRELQAVGQALGGKIAVHEAPASQVGSFGSFTRTVQVYSTPTILLINKHGQTRSLAGLTDAFSIEQAIAEAKR